MAEVEENRPIMQSSQKLLFNPYAAIGLVEAAKV